ncbi:MAG: hypothetical protein CM15mP18_0210 [Methanobacteriota archaeon]|nr:MAG: hypothetical protein CM15mP18_0210 [Euryarchaeota archaeon]
MPRHTAMARHRAFSQKGPIITQTPVPQAADGAFDGPQMAADGRS